MNCFYELRFQFYRMKPNYLGVAAQKVNKWIENQFSS